MFTLTRRRVALILVSVIVLGLLVIGVTATVLYQQLPDLGLLTDYRPQQPLRVYTSDGALIGEFGPQRRYHVPISQTPRQLQDAVLAIEDAGFREHPGVSLRGVLRAAVANLGRARSQGGSTITQQVARTFYLSKKKSYARKIREALLALKIEQHLSKDQILELYMNQIYLGQHAYGFEAASQAYLGKPLAQLTLAESAMLAGLPQNPVHANPRANFERARKRQLLVLARMRSTQLITQAQLEQAQAEPLHIRHHTETLVHAEHVAEMVRQSVYAQYGEATYALGLKVYTSLRAPDQQAAYRALRQGVLAHDRRQPYRGPEAEEELSDGMGADDPALAQLLAEHADDDELRVALVTAASPREVVATLASGEVLHISGDGLKAVQPALSPRAKASLRIQRGSVIRVLQDGPRWAVTQWPEAEGALVALDPQSGRLRALVGGFDFGRNQFNHVTQAWRQPGSSFKPFLYSAALEHGVMPGTLINDAPLPHAPDDGPPEWAPQNADHRYDGALTLREALARSKNMVTIRLVQMLGAASTRQWVSQFGFDADKQPADLTLALGTGSTTPLQLASAYGVLANGGHEVKPVVIERIVNAQGTTLFEAPAPGEPQRVVPARNVFLTQTLLQEVTRSGTAARAQTELQRSDLYGKTGTTSDAVDAWFAGFQPSVTAVAWVGHDNPRSLGTGASGATLALPIWIDYMRHALKGVPVSASEAPVGLVQIDGEWLYSEWGGGGQHARIGFDEAPAAGVAASAPKP